MITGMKSTMMNLSGIANSRAGQAFAKAFACAVLLCSGIGTCAGAPATTGSIEAMHAEQLEADYRVIAARCGSPAFEKAFFVASRKAVLAGLISSRSSPADVERSIGVLRRNSVSLVASSADCPALLVKLKEVQRARQGLLKASKSGSRGS